MTTRVTEHRRRWMTKLKKSVRGYGEGMEWGKRKRRRKKGEGEGEDDRRRLRSVRVNPLFFFSFYSDPEWT